MERCIARLLALFLLLTCGTVAARELAADEDELLAVEVVSVVVLPGIDSPAVLLRDPVSGDMVPIFVGVFEAIAIEQALRGETPPRPQTHDLALSLLDAGAVELKRLVIDELRDDTFFAALELNRVGSDSMLRVDTRPSDGMALALRSGIPILMARRVIELSRPAEPDAPARRVIST